MMSYDINIIDMQTITFSVKDMLYLNYLIQKMNKVMQKLLLTTKYLTSVC